MKELVLKNGTIVEYEAAEPTMKTIVSVKLGPGKWFVTVEHQSLEDRDEAINKTLESEIRRWFPEVESACKAIEDAESAQQ